MTMASTERSLERTAGSQINTLTGTYHLTTSLYVVDEVKHSYTFAVSQDRDYLKGMFWMEELTKSGLHCEIWDVIWDTYYLFYAVSNPHMERYLRKKEDMWCSEHRTCYDRDNIIASITQNFVVKKTCNTIFDLSSKVYSDINISSYNETETVVQILSDYDDINITETPTNRITIRNTMRHLWVAVQKYTYGKIKYVTLPMKYGGIAGLVYSCWLWKNVDDYNAKMNPGRGKGAKLRPRFIVLRVNSSQTKELTRYRKDRQKILRKIPVYKKLSVMRGYHIDPRCCVFPLSRDTLENEGITAREAMWYHWQYYAWQTPVWRSRIRSYGGVPDDVKKTIIWKDDDSNEKFHEVYGYEPDEQSRDVQERANDMKSVVSPNITIRYERQ